MLGLKNILNIVSIRHDVIEEARKLSPYAENDVVAIDLYAQHIYKKLRKFDILRDEQEYNELVDVYWEARRLYKNALHNEIERLSNYQEATK